MIKKQVLNYSEEFLRKEAEDPRYSSGILQAQVHVTDNQPSVGEEVIHKMFTF